MKRTATTRHTKRHGTIPAAKLIQANGINLSITWASDRPVPARMDTVELLVPGLLPAVTA